MRLGGGSWRPWTADDAAKDYLDSTWRLCLLRPSEAAHPCRPRRRHRRLHPPRPTCPSLALRSRTGTAGWRCRSPSGRGPPKPPASFDHGQAFVQALAPDGTGGFWAAVSGNRTIVSTVPGRFFFYHYTDHPPKPVFNDVANPAENTKITAAAGGADGSFWLGDANGNLHRYDRLTGWDKTKASPTGTPSARRPPTRSTRSPSAPTAPGSRSARAGGSPTSRPDSVKLDPAFDRVCKGTSERGPCGIGGDLTKAAVAPDGSALAAAPGASFSGARREGLSARSRHPAGRIVAISMPRPGRAYLATGGGSISRRSRRRSLELDQGERSGRQRPRRRRQRHTATRSANASLIHEPSARRRRFALAAARERHPRRLLLGGDPRRGRSGGPDRRHQRPDRHDHRRSQPGRGRPARPTPSTRSTPASFTRQR